MAVGVPAGTRVARRRPDQDVPCPRVPGRRRGAPVRRRRHRPAAAGGRGLARTVGTGRRPVPGAGRRRWLRAAQPGGHGVRPALDGRAVHGVNDRDRRRRLLPTPFAVGPHRRHVGLGDPPAAHLSAVRGAHGRLRNAPGDRARPAVRRARGVAPGRRGADGHGPGATGARSRARTAGSSPTRRGGSRRHASARSPAIRRTRSRWSTPPASWPTRPTP